MNIKKLILFLILYACLVFFIVVELTLFWVIIAGIVAFSYYVALSNFFMNKGDKGGSGG